MARRIRLARHNPADTPPAPPLWRMAAELGYVFEPIKRIGREIEITPSSSPRTVMLIPGFGAHPLRMRYMASQLERAGHKVKRWGRGFNMGPTPELFDFLEQRLLDIHARYGREVVLVGWSLGGIFARELAKRHPDSVAKVVTMGSPFSGSPRANNVWRAYQLITGHRVDRPPIEADIAEKPPVPTVALWSPRDGIVSPRCACGRPGERDRAKPLRCTHMGFSFSVEAIETVLRELECG